MNLTNALNTAPTLTINGGQLQVAERVFHGGDKILSSNDPGGVVIGTLTVSDLNIDDRHTFSLVGANGQEVSDPNFYLSGNQVIVRQNHQLDYEQAISHTLRVRVTDAGGLTDERDITIQVLNMAGNVNYGAAGATRGNALGSSEEDNLTGTSNADTLSGGAGSDTIIGAAGNDRLHGDNSADTTQSGNDSIDGGDGNDTISGGPGADTLVGGTGIDVLSYADDTAGIVLNLRTGIGRGGQAEGDVVSGFESYVGGRGGDLFIHTFGDATYDGGTGQDTISFAEAQDAITISLSNTREQSKGKNASAIGTVQIKNVEAVIGSTFNDSISGGSQASVLFGGAGDDTLATGSTNDTMHGGLGHDLYLVTKTGTVIVEKEGEGIDTVQATADVVLGNNVENVALKGRNATRATGNDLDNEMTGDSFANTFEGMGGADTINGGKSRTNADTASYRNSDDAVTVTLVHSRSGGAQENFGGHADGDELYDIENIEGSAFDDSLTGNDLANVLIGGAGADTLDGGALSDWVSYASSSAAVQIDLSGDVAVATGGDAEGDLLISIENLIGSAFDDELTGNGFSNVFHGGAGADTIDGQGGFDWIDYSASTAAVNVSLMLDGDGNPIAGQGGDANGDVLVGIEKIMGSRFNDTIEGGAKVDETRAIFELDGGLGIDWIVFTNSSTGIATVTTVTQNRVKQDIDTPFNLGSSRKQVIDGAEYYVKGFENVGGSAHADWFRGSNAANVIDGSGGADTLEGAGGGDQLFGGEGNDSIWGGAGNDLIEGGAGNDVLYGYEFVSGSATTLPTKTDKDIFVMTSGGGNDTIMDFQDGFDLIQFKGLGLTAADIGSKIIISNPHQQANSLQITYVDGEGHSTLLVNSIGAFSLAADDFRFVA